MSRCPERWAWPVSLAAWRTFVIPYRDRRQVPARRRRELALAMLADVTDAVNELAGRGARRRRPGRARARPSPLLWQGFSGPVTIVNSDLPCATGAEIEELLPLPAGDRSSPRTGRRTHLRCATSPTSSRSTGRAARRASSEHLAAVQLEPARTSRDDVDTWDDLERVRDRVGKNTRGVSRDAGARVKVVVLTGGVGGARFLRGIVDAIDPAAVTAIVNVGDDLEVLGLRLARSRQRSLCARRTRRRGTRLGAGPTRRGTRWRASRHSAANRGSASATATSGCTSCARRRCAPARRSPQ